MRPKFRFKNVNSILFIALGIKGMIVWFAYLIPADLLKIVGATIPDTGILISYAPEVWLSLLALVFGTLIIVVSIASENTPRLIDLFIGNPRGRLYIWLIILSSLENIYLQLFSTEPTTFLSNLIFLNSYMLLPVFVTLAIPYAFYILKYTKNANVIEHIYNENVHALLISKSIKKKEIGKNHFILLGTINQLHDLLQYIQFKEPKGDIIQRMGKSLRIYLKFKSSYPPSFFFLSEAIRTDISFRTLSEKYVQIENEKTFYEQKVLKVLGSTYLLLIKDGHYELASLCGSELCETGRLATQLQDKPVMGLVIIHFNTLLRYGINQVLRTREIRNVYNMIYHYSQLVHCFIQKWEGQRIQQCCQYFNFYASEMSKLNQTESLFTFLIETFSWELKKILVALHKGNFDRKLQRDILIMFIKMHGPEQRHNSDRHDNNGVQLIQIALSLFYLNQDEYEFNMIIEDSIVRELLPAGKSMAKERIGYACELLTSEKEEFWEETDQGNRNIFYSADTGQIRNFRQSIFSKIENVDSYVAESK